ncbi:MAG: ATP-binding cassette domain-containing protein [Mollicutes bacterium]|nr:ATP-binding cassette domain-containing protein [Mollicutes bacterium]
MEIKFNQVGYCYNEQTPLQKEVLKDINIAIIEGKINGIFGKSGSGKTTLVEMINALLIPTVGHIKVDNYIIEKNKKIVNVNTLRCKVGIVFENPEDQFFNTTVKKEIEFGMKYFNYKTDKIEDRIIDALKMVGLDETFLERDPFSLSSGEKRKVAIASILTFNPKVIIFDEPTLGLDYNSKVNLIRIIKMLKNKYNKTIIITTHDVDLLHQLADYIFVLHNKKVVMEGNKNDIFSRVDELKKYDLPVPKIIEFANKVYIQKNIKMGYRDDINDLIKDIYRYVK